MSDADENQPPPPPLPPDPPETRMEASIRNAMEAIERLAAIHASQMVTSGSPPRDTQSVVEIVRCEFLQCTVLGKHGAVSDDVTLRGRDVIFFLKQAKIILRCRYAPGMPRPGVSK